MINETNSKNVGQDINAFNRASQVNVDSKHVDSLIQVVRVSVNQAAKPVSRNDGGGLHGEYQEADRSSAIDIETKDASKIGRMSNNVDVGTNSKSSHPEAEIPEGYAGIVLPSSIPTGVSSVVPPELDTLIQMLMMLFGSGAISSNDKRKVMDFIRELISLANQSGDVELKMGLDYVFKKGLGRLRQDGDVLADDMAELERLILGDS